MRFFASGPGDREEWNIEFPSSEPHWQVLNVAVPFGSIGTDSGNSYGDTDLYSYNVSSLGPGPIRNVTIHVIADWADDSPGTITLAVTMKRDGTETLTDDQTTPSSTGPSVLEWSFDLDPITGLPWVSDDISATQFGPTIHSGGSLDNRTEVIGFWLEVVHDREIVWMDSFDVTADDLAGDGTITTGTGGLRGGGALIYTHTTPGAYSIPEDYRGSGQWRTIGFQFQGGNGGDWSPDGLTICGFVGTSPLGYTPVLVLRGGDIEVWSNFDTFSSLLGTASGALSDPDTMYHIQLHVFFSTTAGVVEIKVDDTIVLTLTGLDLLVDDDRPAPFIGPDLIDGEEADVDCYLWYEDLWATDGELGYLGIQEVNVLRGTGSYLFDSPWDSTNPDQNPGQQVDEIPSDLDTTYVFNSDDATTSPVLITNSSGAISEPDSSIIPAIFVKMVGKRVTSPVDFYTNLIDRRDSSAFEDVFGLANPWGSVYEARGEVYDANPITGVTDQWTVADVNHLAWGFRLLDSAGRVRISTYAIEYLSPIIVATVLPFQFGAVIG